MALVKLVPRGLRDGLRRILDPFLARHGYVRFDVDRHYGQDGLFTVHNDDFRSDPRFREAYARGVEASRGVDAAFHWRIHVALWAARNALHADGDFVECGVNAGFVSSAIMRSLDWANVPRRFFLIDTFSGPVLDQYSADERGAGRDRVAQAMLARGAYVTDLERVRANFAEWPNAVVTPGAVPDVLATLDVGPVAFLHIDLNCALPERAALEYFWPKLSLGGMVLLDDYANNEYVLQKREMDEAARRIGAHILALPTGQGLILK